MKEKIKILFATDFSDASKVALQTLEMLQGKFQPDISLIHVIISGWKDWFASGLFEKEAKQRLLSWQERIEQHPSDPNKLFVRKGNAAEAILALANQIKVELILLGGEKSGQHRKFITGTTAAAVVRSATIPVLLAKSTQIKNIICAVDGSEPSAQALTAAINISRRFQAKLHIIHVLVSIDINPLGIERAVIEQKEREYEQQMVAEIEKFYSEFDFKGIEVEKTYPWGRPAKVILNLAEDFAYDLIVVGSTGHGKVSRALLGSTAEKILRHAPCSLLVMR